MFPQSGQTFRENARRFEKIYDAKHVHGKKEKEGILVDGKDSDYETSGIMTPDCRYGTFDMVIKTSILPFFFLLLH